MLALAQKEEQQSSNALLVAGCPPCYPIDAVFPLPKDAEEYEAVSYFNSLPGSTGHEPLTTQLHDWNTFIKFQQANRRHYLQRNTFPAFLDKVQDRRRRHGLDGDVRFRPDPKQQSPLDNWIEFQHYHLGLHEIKEKELVDAKNALDDFRAEPRAVDPEGVVSHYEWAVKAKALKVQKHSKMLQWIEQHRKAMTKKQTASNHTTTEQEHPRTIPSPTSLPTSPKHRRRGRKPRPPLSPIPSALTKKRGDRKVGCGFLHDCRTKGT